MLVAARNIERVTAKTRADVRVGPLVLLNCNNKLWNVIQSCSVYVSTYTYSHEHNNITISSDM